MVYYARASLELSRQDGRRPNFIIPTGNLGNALACVWARECGLPIGDIVLASNANAAVPDYLQTGEWRPRASIATLASAMDVGNPSNMERLRWLFPDWRTSRGRISARPVSDDEIRTTIRRDYAAFGHAWCPHTATAACVYRGLEPRRHAERWVLVATAHPAKFNDIVEPLIGATVPVPPALAALLDLPSVQTDSGAAARGPSSRAHGGDMNLIFGLPAWLWALLALGLVAVVAYFGWEMIQQRRARRAIDNVISSVAFEELRNVLLPTGTGEQIHVNYLLLTQRGLLVIELFDVPGVIFAGEKMEQWSVFGPKRHFTFTNPLPMLYDRMAAVRNLAGDVPVEGRVVFSMLRRISERAAGYRAAPRHAAGRISGRGTHPGRRRSGLRRSLGTHQEARPAEPSGQLRVR